MPPLSEWGSFYVIVGSSAAALTGLMFVVIALGAEARTLTSELGVRAFASPIIVHFCAVLLIAAIVTTPHQTVRSLQTCLLIGAAAGLVYSTWAVAHVWIQKSYAPVLEDFIWHVTLPLAAYLVIFGTGLAFRREPREALYVVGACALLLLFVGIHNAWDSAVYMATRRQRSKEKAGEARLSAKTVDERADDRRDVG